MYVNVTRKVGKYRVHKYNVDNEIILAAYEPSSIFGPHSVLMRFGNKEYGQIGTRHHTEKEYAKAYHLIVKAFPDVLKHHIYKDHGRIIYSR